MWHPPSGLEGRVLWLQVGFLSALDLMLGQLVKRLHSAASSTGARYFVAVTGDHSTPVEYGDHSHEPVPFSIAPVRWQLLQCAAADFLASIVAFTITLHYLASQLCESEDRKHVEA